MAVPFFIANQFLFLKKIPGLCVCFFCVKKREAGRVEGLRKVDGLVVDILTLVADKFFGCFGILIGDLRVTGCVVCILAQTCLIRLRDGSAANCGTDF